MERELQVRSNREGWLEKKREKISRAGCEAVEKIVSGISDTRTLMEPPQIWARRKGKG